MSLVERIYIWNTRLYVQISWICRHSINSSSLLFSIVTLNYFEAFKCRKTNSQIVWQNLTSQTLKKSILVMIIRLFQKFEYNLFHNFRLLFGRIEDIWWWVLNFYNISNSDILRGVFLLLLLFNSKCKFIISLQMFVH